MKRIISLFAVLVFLSSFNLAAQNFFDLDDQDEESKVFVSFGPSIGMTASSLSSSLGAFEDFGTRGGFTASAFVNIRFFNRDIRSKAETGLLAFQPELRFATLGGNGSESKLGLGYITIPLMLQVYPLEQLYLEMGPAMCLNISHTPNSIVTSNSEFNLDNLRANDVAFAFGVGYKFNNLGVGARYYIGLSNIASNMLWKNRWLEMGLSYSFSLK